MIYKNKKTGKIIYSEKKPDGNFELLTIKKQKIKGVIDNSRILKV
jgi:hypothetical protein